LTTAPLKPSTVAADRRFTTAAFGSSNQRNQQSFHLNTRRISTAAGERLAARQVRYLALPWQLVPTMLTAAAAAHRCCLNCQGLFSSRCLDPSL